MANFNGSSLKELARENISPKFAFRRDQVTCKRLLKCNWEDMADACLNLRGLTTISTSGTRFLRQLPHTFSFQTMAREFVCMDITEVNGLGLPRNNDGTIDTTLVQSATKVLDDDDVGFSDEAALQVEYYVAQFAVINDDSTNDPIDGGDGINDAGLDEEWDRFTEWNIEFSTEMLSVPQAAFRYMTKNGVAVGAEKDTLGVSTYIQIPIISAKVSAKVYGLPIIPPAAMQFQGCVNHKDFSFFLQPVDGPNNSQEFTAAKETLLFLSSKTDERTFPDGTKCYDITYFFSYRPQGQNFLPNYVASDKRLYFDRVAVDFANQTADGSAIFKLRNFGYFWSPKTPT